LPQVKARLDEIRESFAAVGTKALFVSAATGQGIPELMTETMRILQSAPKPEASKRRKVFRPQPRL
jgi:hypothetical protein